MAKTIQITDLKIVHWSVNVEDRSVVVTYDFKTAEDETFASDTAVFWVTIPDPIPDPMGGEDYTPVNWYQLPPQYESLLVDLTIDVKNALLHLIND